MNNHTYDTEPSQNPTRFIKAREVKQRYGVSDMTLWRWIKSDLMGFPAPIYINGHRHWTNHQLDEFDARVTRSPQAA